MPYLSVSGAPRFEAVRVGAEGQAGGFQEHRLGGAGSYERLGEKLTGEGSGDSSYEVRPGLPFFPLAPAKAHFFPNLSCFLVEVRLFLETL